MFAYKRSIDNAADISNKLTIELLFSFLLLFFRDTKFEIPYMDLMK